MRLIDADALFKEIPRASLDGYPFGGTLDPNCVYNLINDAPTINTVPIDKLLDYLIAEDFCVSSDKCNMYSSCRQHWYKKLKGIINDEID